jgi:hypothetical protein
VHHQRSLPLAGEDGRLSLSFVVPGLVPGIHVFLFSAVRE